jgi:hypothetical protein
MLPILSGLALVGALQAWPPEEAPQSYLFKMRPTADRQVEWQRETFKPQEGDIVLYDDHNAFITRVYKLVGTDGPLHAGIVYRRPDGAMALLEAGANRVPRVQFLDVDQRVRGYDGTVLVRRLKTPLTPEQSKKLTEFCHAQEGKSYAVLRLMLQGTPLRPRGVLNPVLGKTSLERERWICSELVVAAATAAGVLSTKDYHANAIFPRDLCYDESVNLTAFYEPPALWYPDDHLDVVRGGAIRVTPASKSAGAKAAKHAPG